MALAITKPDDPRIADYRHLKERHLNAAGNRFVAESERVVRRLLASDLRVCSVLVTPPRLAAMAAELDAETRFPVYVASQDVIDGIAGFHVHRGCLAIGERPARRPVPDDARLVVAVEDLVDVDNLGSIVRNAVAFGAAALLLSPRAADPFYRKAIRVSLGGVFALPVHPPRPLARRAGRAAHVPRLLDRRRGRRCRGDAARRVRAAGEDRAAARRRGAGSVGGGAGRLRSPGDDPDGAVGGRGFAERGDRGRDLPLSPVVASGLGPQASVLRLRIRILRPEA